MLPSGQILLPPLLAEIGDLGEERGVHPVKHEAVVERSDGREEIGGSEGLPGVGDAEVGDIGIGSEVL